MPSRRTSQQSMSILGNMGKMPDIGDFEFSTFLALQTRTVVLSSGIDDELANRIIPRLMYLDAANDKPITLLVNSMGGDAYSGFAIANCLLSLRSTVRTVCVGAAMSAGLDIFVAGTMGHRYSCQMAMFMVHSTMDEVPTNKASELVARAKHIVDMNTMMATFLASRSKRKKRNYEALFKKADQFMTPAQAKEMGLVDHIIPDLCHLPAV